MVTGQLLTDHLAVGVRALTTALPRLGLFPALPLWLYWWCQPQFQKPCGHDPGRGLLNQAHSHGIAAYVGAEWGHRLRRGPVALGRSSS